MKIAIDISQVIYKTGVSQYTRKLVENLLKVDKKNEYVLFGSSLRRRTDLRAFVSGLKGNFESKLFRIPPTLGDILWNRLHVLLIERLVGGLDVFSFIGLDAAPKQSF